VRLQLTHLLAPRCVAQGIASAILTVITWLFTIFLIPRLRVAIAVIEVACGALRKVPMLTLFPFVGGLAISGFMVWFVAVGVFVYSSGKMVRRDCCSQVQAAFADMYPGYMVANSNEPPSCAEIHCGYEVREREALCLLC
jgi:choline transporter-like protein 2/4/5